MKERLLIFMRHLEEESETFIANGEIGKIFQIGMHYMIIDFDGVKIKYSRDDLQGIKLGYSISIHKSQGGSAKVVILLTPQAKEFGNQNRREI